MTRNRALGNVPNELMAEYYGQRASAGLIITEGTAVSPNSVGYPRIPGIYTPEQVRAWRASVDAAHRGGAKIFLQLMHTGRISHANNLPQGEKIVAPSALAAKESMYTDSAGPQPLPVPEAMSPADIKAAIQQHVQAARNALEAGFDGVELHGANGYLIEQFLRPTSNQRTDEYGGDIGGRSRFLLELIEAVERAVGKQRLGVRLSPFGVFNDMPLYEQMESDYTRVSELLGQANATAYVHLVDHTSMGAPAVPQSIKQTFRKNFRGTLILSGGYDAQSAERDLAAGAGDLIGFGRPFLANPDLPTRFRSGATLNAPDFATFYMPGEKGYTDYPTL